MKFVLFYHSFVSCWNHGNVHFLRGVARELLRRGHEVTVYEPENGWSRINATLEQDGARALAEGGRLVPGVSLALYGDKGPDLDQALEDADVVVVHEWNKPELIEAVARKRLAGGQFVLLFHDTHHRAVTAPQELGRFSFAGYDAILAFGEALRQIYLAAGWGARAFAWHEAADTALFRPLPRLAETDLIWIGNWGDDERTKELEQFLIGPASRLRLRTRIHGVRYPEGVLRRLAENSISFGGWLPNHRAPAAFARARVTVHVPRRAYVEALPGIPTIRMFEALACGIPLLCAPWSDTEGLFPAGSYLAAQSEEQMTAALSLVLRDCELAAELSHAGLCAIRSRHTCAHRAAELLDIIDKLRRPEVAPRQSASSKAQALAS
jgi:spore maturation protein CgeB